MENPSQNAPCGQVDLPPRAKINLTLLPKIKMPPVDRMCQQGILYVSLDSVLADGEIIGVFAVSALRFAPYHLRVIELAASRFFLQPTENLDSNLKSGLSDETK